ncbi:MAG: UDP-N-acetylglucosamine pyrophosphorylase [Thermoleophilia bacterium]|nr:UDP-N-acetylglucosamine pyrophosphorylase [Thermoleophilia bacterium]
MAGIERDSLAVMRLIEKGATVPDPQSVYIAPEVDLDRISADGLVIYPGCRIHGKDTVVCSGVILGAEGPVTLENCAVGSGVELKGGYFRASVFLDRVVLGSGSHVREGCLLEEEASGAHCVGLKQTILFPFVTLGSLVNFCDCLMAGGTSRRDHSEVGSSFVHFNYTPLGHKATASLFGDVPQGVMLRQPRIFLGGQGGVVGPVRVAYGTVLAAGSILRHDVLEPGRLVVASMPEAGQRDWKPETRGLGRVLRNNFYYLANLAALRAWYEKVRRRFLVQTDLGKLVYEQALAVLSGATDERIRRLRELAELVGAAGPAEFGAAGPAAHDYAGPAHFLGGSRKPDAVRRKIEIVCGLFSDEGVAKSVAGSVSHLEEDFLSALEVFVEPQADYLTTIRGLPQEVATKGVAWLSGIVEGYVERSVGELGTHQ